MRSTRVTLVAFWMVCFLAPLVSAQTSRDTTSSRKHLTRFNRQIVDRHQQLYDNSCIPMSLEMVLKLLERVPSSYYELQNHWKNKSDGNFGNFDGETIAGVTFHKQFPLNKLFEIIDKELKAGRFVVVSLASAAVGTCTSSMMRMPLGIFWLFPRQEPRPSEAWRLKSTIKEMQGTDIMTYDPGKPVPRS